MPGNYCRSLIILYRRTRLTDAAKGRELPTETWAESRVTVYLEIGFGEPAILGPHLPESLGEEQMCQEGSVGDE